MHFVVKAATNYLRDLCGAKLHQAKNQTRSGVTENFLAFSMKF